MQTIDGRARLFQDTVVRPDSQGFYWLMNRPEGGMASSGRRYRSLDEITELWAVELGDRTQDQHGEIIPARAIRETGATCLACGRSGDIGGVGMCGPCEARMDDLTFGGNRGY